ncbi:MAG: hypothetical protein GY950_15175 [bacterium]|nr:hypothetical protein [bacterium]
MNNVKRKEIVIITPGRESMALYKMYLTTHTEFAFRNYFSIEEFSAEMFNSQNYAGFIVDLRSILKAEGNARETFTNLTEAFPMVRISHSIDKKTVKGNIRDKNYQDKELFDHFMKDLCRGFTPRGLRTKKRKDAFLNVLLDFSADASGKNTVKTNSANISENGGFFITGHETGKGDTVYLQIKELSDHSPIQCTVKWVQPWGSTIRHLPGFGVSFTQIKPAQAEELARLLRGPA